MLRKVVLFILIFFSITKLFAQNDDSLHLSIFFDSYASWTPSAKRSLRPEYVVNYKDLNAVGLNFMAAALHYSTKHFRTNLGLMTGEYAHQNLLSEDPAARNIYEANIGYRFTEDEEIWLDAGVLPSHIGLESVPGFNNYTATRNIISDITPYYETGLRLSYRPNNAWYLAILALNGWQRITAPLSTFGKNWGMQIQYRPLPYWEINSSSFIGEMPGLEPLGSRRIYSNLFSSIALNPRMSVTVGWDWGMQGSRNQQWNDLMIQYRYTIKHNKLFINSRYELLADPAGLFIPKIVLNSPRHHLTSINVDYLSNHKLKIRTEINYMFAQRSNLNAQNPATDRQLSIFIILSARLDYKK